LGRERTNHWGAEAIVFGIEDDASKGKVFNIRALRGKLREEGVNKKGSHKQ